MLKKIINLGLIVLCICSSVFMVAESAVFYNRLYPSFFSILAAGLVEAFIILFAALAARGWTRAWANILVVGLFILSVGSASANLLDPLLNRLIKSDTAKAKERVLQRGAALESEFLKKTIDSNQKTNAALSAKRNYETTKALTGALDAQESSTALWLSISIVVMLRLLLQLSNVFCAYLFGRTFIVPKRPKLKRAEPINQKTPAKAMIDAQTPLIQPNYENL